MQVRDVVSRIEHNGQFAHVCNARVCRKASTGAGPGVEIGRTCVPEVWLHVHLAVQMNGESVPVAGMLRILESNLICAG
jgi:hypothetical protein